MINLMCYNSSVGTAARYELAGPGIESWWEGAGEIFRTLPDWPWGPPRLLYENWVFPRGKAAAACR